MEMPAQGGFSTAAAHIRSLVPGSQNKRMRKYSSAKRRHVCGKCGESFSKEDKLRRHIIKHVHKCTSCNQSFQCPASLTRHKRLHRECNSSITREVNSHQSHQSESTDDTLHCRVCGEVCENIDILRKHLQTHKKYSCHICYKSFQLKSGLIVHLNIHRADNPFTCSHCERAFDSLEPLKIHMNNHTEADRVKFVGTKEIGSHSVGLSSSAYINHTNLEFRVSQVVHEASAEVSNDSNIDFQTGFPDLCDSVGMDCWESLDVKTEDVKSEPEVTETNYNIGGQVNVGASKIKNSGDGDDESSDLLEGSASFSESMSEGISPQNQYLPLQDEDSPGSNDVLEATPDSIKSEGFECLNTKEEVLDSDEDDGMQTVVTRSHNFKLPTYRCRECHETFATSYNLKMHMKLPHIHKCRICNQSFRYLSSLFNHKKLHQRCNSSNTKRSEPSVLLCCKICGDYFESKYVLEKHQEIHKAYSCNVCNKSFHWRRSWKRHLNIHRPDNPYTCNHCEKVFDSSSNLKQHLATHVKKEAVVDYLSESGRCSTKDSEDIWTITGLVSDTECTNDVECKVCVDEVDELG